MKTKDNLRRAIDNGCLYRCGSKEGSTHQYHVYPSSASCIPLLLPEGVVCNKCNQYFSKLENYFVHRQPGADVRLLHVAKTKKGKPPIFEAEPGTATRVDRDETYEVNYPLSEIKHEMLANGDIVLKCYANRFPFDSRKISRILVKMAFESLYPFEAGSDFDQMAPIYDVMRSYARYGKGNFVWFAWKRSAEVQKFPQFICIQDRGSPPVAKLCRLSLPGIAFLVPIPPYVAVAAIPDSLSGWEIVSTSGLHTLSPTEIEFNLLRVQSSVENSQQTHAFTLDAGEL